MNRPVLAILTAAALLAVQPGVAQTMALRGATLIDGAGGTAVDNAMVVVTGDQLACVGEIEDCPVPEGAEVFDATGKFITPGLVDAHVHFAQTGWLDGRPDAIAARDLFPYERTMRDAMADPGRWHRSYLCSGIIAVFDVGGPPWTITLGEKSGGRARAARVRASGPLITWVEEEAMQLDEEIYTFLPMGSTEETLDSVEKLRAAGAQAVKVWYVDPPASRRRALDARLSAIGRAAADAGLPLLVHATSLREAKAALRAGAHMLVHSVDDEPVDAEFLELLTATGAVYAPTMIVGRNWGRALTGVIFGEISPIDDPNGCVDQETVDKIDRAAEFRPYLPDHFDAVWASRRLEEDNRKYALIEANLIAVRDAGGLIATATDAGNPLTLHGPAILWEMEAMQQAGLEPEEIIVMSTRNGARAMLAGDRFGVLTEGMAADLLLLDEDPRIDIAAFRSLSHVMRAGVLHDRSGLSYRRTEKETPEAGSSMLAH